MVIHIDGRKGPVESEKFLLGFRDTVMLSLGFLPGSITRHRLYHVYSKVHQQLTRIGAIEFDMVSERVFLKMIQKLHNQKLVEETYVNKNYGIDLTVGGQAAFEVILSNVQAHPEFNRILNIFNFYRNTAA